VLKPANELPASGYPGAIRLGLRKAETLTPSGLGAFLRCSRSCIRDLLRSQRGETQGVGRSVSLPAWSSTGPLNWAGIGLLPIRGRSPRITYREIGVQKGGSGPVFPRVAETPRGSTAPRGDLDCPRGEGWLSVKRCGGGEHHKVTFLNPLPRSARGTSRWGTSTSAAHVG